MMHKKNRKNNYKNKEPSLLSKIITVHFEQAKRRKAIRILQKQEWSFDFLALLLVKASRLAKDNLSLTITDRAGVSCALTYDRAKSADSVQQFDDDIFNHLDDDLAVSDFIRRNSTR